MSARAQYARLFDRGGRRVTIERPVANGDAVTAANVRVRIRDFTAEEIAGGVQAGTRRMLVLAEDLPEGFAPLRAMDGLTVDGVRLTIVERPEDQTHRDGALLLAYDCRVSGA